MFENREGKRVPDVTSGDLFGGKTVVVFSLPGAFTPTCSSSHVPRYDQLVPELRAHGVDEVVCMSVNDAFVMNEWQTSQNAGIDYEELILNQDYTDRSLRAIAGADSLMTWLPARDAA